MIKVFTLNKNGKIELTKKQLEQLLNESYWEGYGYSNRKNIYWTYTSPSLLTTAPPVITVSDSSNPYTIDSSSVSNNSITIKTNLGD